MCSVYCHVIITLVCVLLPTCKYVCMFVCSVSVSLCNTCDVCSVCVQPKMDYFARCRVLLIL